jgi:micrococcal nuclease
MGNLLASEVKKNYKQEIFFLFILIFILFLINYSYLDKKLISFFSTEESLIKEKVCFVERVVDGDTIIACGNTTRLLGINTPEKGEFLYSLAKEYLVKRIENKTIKLVFSNEKKDRYGRVLAYVYFENKNINQELIKNGFANPYFPSSKDKNFNSFLSSWEECTLIRNNLCENSKDICANCIQLKNLNLEKETILLYNSCDFSCDLENWTIKDEGRKIFTFPFFKLESNSELEIITANDSGVFKNKIYWTSNDYVWTDSGDTIFIRDSKGKLVLWKNYF